MSRECVGAGPGNGAKDNEATSSMLTMMDSPSDSGKKGVNWIYTPSTCYNVDNCYILPTPNIHHNACTPNMSHNDTAPITTNASTYSISHGPVPANDTANDTSSLLAVTEDEWTGKTRPLHTPVKHPRPPDSVNNEVEHAGEAAEVEARELDEVKVKVEVAPDTNSDDECQPGMPTEPPNSIEEKVEMTML